MLKCPSCKDGHLKVIASRMQRDGNFMRRRVECRNCQERFSSYELRKCDLKDPSLSTFFETLHEIRENKRLRDPRRDHIKPESVVQPYQLKGGPCWMEKAGDVLRRYCPQL